jgi:hypothetical protein
VSSAQKVAEPILLRQLGIGSRPSDQSVGTELKVWRNSLTLVTKASPMKQMFSIERSAALLWPRLGVLDDNRYKAQVSAVAHSGIYSNLGGDPANHERNQATVTERHSQGRTFESRHRNLIENRLVSPYANLRRKLKAWAASQEPWVDRFGVVNALPSHRLTELKHSGKLCW